MIAARSPVAMLFVLALGCDELATEPASGPTIAAPEGAATSDEPAAPLATDACNAELAGRTPVELRVALEGLGWSTVYADACAMEAARRAADPTACAALSVRALRDHCRDRIAIETGAPLACHGDDRGHAPLCLALAARRPALCRSVPLADRALCEALLGEGVDRCGRPDVPDGAGCRARHGEIAALVGEPSDEPIARPHVLLRTTRVVELGAHTSREEPVEEDLSDVERGAVLRWDGCVAVLTLGEPELAPLSRRTERFVEVRLPPRMFHDDASAADESADVPLGPEARARIARPAFGTAEGGGPLGGHGSVHVEPFQPALGSAVTLRLTGELSRSPGHVEVELTAEIPLRDVVGTRDCPAEVPR